MSIESLNPGDLLGGSPGNPSPLPDNVRAHLEKIRNSEPFVRSLRIQKLLEFLVESVLAEHQDRLKETVIGIEVFDRSPDYDPKTDPVVRVEMRRLRSKLSEYYLREGQSDEVLIWLEKGSYVPSLVQRADSTASSTRPEREEIRTTPEMAFSTTDERILGEVSPEIPRRNRLIWILSASAALLIAAVLALFLSRSSNSSHSLRLFPLTGNAGLEMSPAFSPDGKQVAYSWDGGRRNFDIYVKPAQGGAPRRLTDNAAHDVHPSWSPDGQRIAFLRVFPDKSELLVIPSLGGIESIISTVATSSNRWHADYVEGAAHGGPTWSPDASYLLISRPLGDGSAVGISKISMDGHEQPMTVPPLGSSDIDPSISPSGALIAFVRSTSAGSSDLHTVSARGGKPVRLTFDQREIQGIDWVDGENLIYSSNRGGNFRLWQMSRRGGDAQPVSAGGSTPEWPVVSHDGRWLAFVELLNNASIWRMPLTGDDLTGRTEPFISSAGSDHSPAFSPDGKRIAYVSDRSGSWQIWLSDIDGAGIRQLTDFKGSLVGTPRWSPDSQRLIFDGQFEDHSAIWLIDGDGGNLHRLNDNGVREYLPSWSRDGQWVYFCSLRDGQDRLWKQSPTSGQAIELTKDLFIDAVESSDGKLIYMERAQGSIWQMPARGGRPQPIPELVGIHPARYWTVTDDTLYIVRQEQSPRELLAFNLVTRKFRALTTIPAKLMGGTPGLAVDPKRQQILFVQRNQPRSVIMLQER